jgi:hypothetical protein
MRGKDANKTAGNRFQLLMVLFTKEYLLRVSIFATYESAHLHLQLRYNKCLYVSGKRVYQEEKKRGDRSR